ncbi:cobalt-factor II C(20)-methyltransferase [Vagococcus intermedius]|uniref:Cobalt-factor II C(20)-methyltransferase n=1 Tax=Vagococcus intermedius TaxID=2991418 RepID=A0AAF0CTU2_9ENTE|nr:cobalt-factor II C(20)-methyltransferase [Vagococcus intermedius]WEG72732.1 cobalt-factor II C(20)-methyltransferase [Vagococcus intermedius]WEG74818.1 cobalt-factor II C(20)-methyltransferase [Vagococcus intermedius]
MAKFYGIGTGPGDSDLMTVKGANLLKKMSVLYTPEAKKASKSLALSIVEPFLNPELEIKQRHFPMTNDWEEKMISWQTIAKEISADVRSGQDVAFITLGDPMVYSTYSYLLDLLDDDIETETVPGIASFISMASQVQLPLCIDEEKFAVIPATVSAEEIKNGILQNDTVVLMKVANHLPKVLPILREANLLEQTILISHASQAKEVRQMTIKNLKETDKLSYFSTMIVYKNRQF